MISSLHEIYCLLKRRLKIWVVYWLSIQLVNTLSCLRFKVFLLSYISVLFFLFFTSFMIFVTLEVIVYACFKKRTITIKWNNNYWYRLRSHYFPVLSAFFLFLGDHVLVSHPNELSEQISSVMFSLLQFFLIQYLSSIVCQLFELSYSHGASIFSLLWLINCLFKCGKRG